MHIISSLKNIENAETFWIKVCVNDEFLKLFICCFDTPKFNQLLDTIGDSNEDIYKATLLFRTQSFLVFLYRNVF